MNGNYWEFWGCNFTAFVAVICYVGPMKKNLLWPLALILVFALSRWPGLMPDNFSAAYALVFCAGLYVQGWAGWIVPLGVMFVTDFLISRFHYHQPIGPFLAGMLPNYIAYAGLIGLGRLFGGKRPWWMLLGGGILGALLFYIVTNTAAWVELPYAKTFTGWIQALTTGFPEYPQTWEFFLKTLGSGGLFTGLFVGAMKLTESSESAEESEKEESKEPEPASEPVKAES